MFTSDDRGLVEPNSDMVAMVLAAVGFIVFITLAAHTYQVYQQTTYIAQHYNDAAALADLIMKDPALCPPDRPDLVDASRFEGLTADQVRDLKERYGTRYDFSLKIEVPPGYSYVVGTSRDMGVSASVPVTIRLNEVQEMPGTLTVKIWEK